MEQGMTVPLFADAQKRDLPAKRGFMLVTVLIVTAVGLLFGAGALLLFRFQCQMRIDRQHELEKVYAVRSALNYVRMYDKEIGSQGKSFRYYTGSERDLGLIVKPVPSIFPDLGNSKHFAMQNDGNFLFPCQEQYNSSLDYEYGAIGVTNLLMSNKDQDGRFGLAFTDLTASNNVRWWVNIGMRGTGGWLQEDYGRRYYFEPWAYVDGHNENTNGVKDVMRLCIIRNVTNESEKVGCRHGWPLSREGERALVFQISPSAGGKSSREQSAGEESNAEMALYEYEYVDGRILRKPLFDPPLTDMTSLSGMGMQIADDTISVFFIDNDNPGDKPYTFPGSVVRLTPGTYKYFAEEVIIGGKTYGGIYTNDVDGKVYAPELRAVFEVEAASNRRPFEGNDKSKIDFLTNFRVSPAYQYDVFLEHPNFVTNRATVAQKIGVYSKRDGRFPTVLTYDTHGTENKGFRKDEKLARERRGGN